MPLEARLPPVDEQEPEPAWLSDDTPLQFNNLPAARALSLVVPNKLLSIQFNAPSIPVSALPGSTRKEHLNAICAAADWHWTLKKGIVIISDVETRVWDILSLPGAVDGSVNTTQLYDDSGDASVNQTVSSNPHEELLTTLESMLEQSAEVSGFTSINELAQSYDIDEVVTTSHEREEAYASVALIPNTGQIIATARPSQLDRMERVVNAHNAAATRRVELEFVLFEVDVTDTENRRLDLKGLIQKSMDWDLDIRSPASSVTGSSGSLTVKPLEGSSMSGSQAIFEWLQSQGDTTVQISKNVVALHNQVTVLSDLDTLRYIEEVSIQQQATGPTATISPTVTTARLDTGETWSVVASITDEQVIVRLASSRADLVELASYQFTEAIQGSLPQTTSSSVSTSIFLRDGETRIISDLNSQESTDRETRSPIIDVLLPFIGRGVSTNERRVETVMAMTARIL